MADPLGEALYARSQTVSALTTIISTRCYPGRLPQNPVYPCCTYEVISEQRRQTPDTAAGGHDGVPQSRVQITAFATTRAGAWTLVNSGLKAAFAGWKGASGGVTVQGTSLDAVTVVGYDARVKAWAIACDFFVWFEGT